MATARVETTRRSRDSLRDLASYLWEMCRQGCNLSREYRLTLPHASASRSSTVHPPGHGTQGRWRGQRHGMRAWMRRARGCPQRLPQCSSSGKQPPRFSRKPYAGKSSFSTMAGGSSRTAGHADGWRRSSRLGLARQTRRASCVTTVRQLWDSAESGLDFGAYVWMPTELSLVTCRTLAHTPARVTATLVPASHGERRGHRQRARSAAGICTGPADQNGSITSCSSKPPTTCGEGRDRRAALRLTCAADPP